MTADEVIAALGLAPHPEEGGWFVETWRDGAAIDAAAFDLKAVNPNVRTTQDNRTPAEILDTIERHGQAVGEALARLRGLMDASSMAG